MLCYLASLASKSNLLQICEAMLMIDPSPATDRSVRQSGVSEIDFPGPAHNFSMREELKVVHV